MGDMNAPALSFPKNAPPARIIFLSYRSIDDEPPPENPDGGYVTQLRKQLRWELNQLGVPDATVWMDRCKIQPGDIWSEVLKEELKRADLFIALSSRNYINSEWCEREISTMAARVASFEKEARRQRIFRVDKHRVPDERLHEALRNAQAVRFFEHDKEMNWDEEFFYRGQVRGGSKYYDAIRMLAEAIHRRLEELGVEMGPQAKPLAIPPPAHNGRTVFVAKPARDMNAAYETLTAELTRSGYRVLPDPTAELPETAEEAQSAIVSGLAEAELSIHFLGERTGVRPDGLNADIVPFQLECAAAEAGRRPAFYRMIWAPKRLTSHQGEGPEPAPRDPFAVLSRFGDKLPSDQIDSDTATRFNEFVFQRLSRKAEKSAKTIYVHCAEGDRAFALQVSKQLKKAGLSPLLPPSEGAPDEREAAERTLVEKSDHVALCWGAVSQCALLQELSEERLALWKGEQRKLALFMGPPDSGGKAEVLELGLGSEIDSIHDIREPGAIEGEIAKFHSITD